MNIRSMFVGVILTLSALDASAETLRYAIVVGSNGAPERSSLPDLVHAEQEAVHLGRALVRYGRFDQANVHVLRGPTRDQLLSTVRGLERQVRRDLESHPQADTLFAFFFTGHGEEGRLLLKDGPLKKEDLGNLFRTVNAGFSVGVFDACYSASLSPDELLEKGEVRPLPGINVVRALPDDVLKAAGTVWYVSSGPNQLSYEDPKHGGVFTHYFIEGMRRARATGPGIRLDDLYEYARRKTIEHTLSRNKPQSPQMVSDGLRAGAFPFFSFPVSRSASLRLGPEVDGEFELTYDGGAHVERIRKKGGKALTLSVYPGQATLIWRRGQDEVAHESLNLGRAPVALDALRGQAAKGLGRRQRELFRKGLRDQTFIAREAADGLTTQLGLTYGFTPPLGEVLGPEHSAALSVRFDHGQVVGGADVGYAYADRTFDAWSFTAHAVVLRAHAGYGLDRARWRLTFGGEVSALHTFQTYGDGSERAGWTALPGAFIDATTPVDTEVKWTLGLAGGVSLGPGLGVATDFALGGWITLRTGVLINLY